MAGHNLLWNIQFPSNQPHFIFKKLPQWFYQTQIHLLRQTTDVMMTLDRCRRPSNGHRFDDVRIKSPLDQELYVSELSRFLLKNVDENFAYPFSLLFWITNAS